MFTTHPIRMKINNLIIYTFLILENNIDVDVLALMSAEELRELIPKIGDRVKIRNYIDRLSAQKLTFAVSTYLPTFKLFA